MTVEQGIMVLYAIGQLAGTAHLLWRVTSIEKKLGNGSGAGIFLRHDVAAEKHKDFERRISQLEQKKEAS